MITCRELAELLFDLTSGELSGECREGGSAPARLLVVLRVP